MINQQGFHFDSPNFQDSFNIISDGNTYGQHLRLFVLIKDIVPIELVNAISQQRLHFDSPNFQDSFNMALSQVVLHMDYIDQILHAN